jgi:hypothetical protein
MLKELQDKSATSPNLAMDAAVFINFMEWRQHRRMIKKEIALKQKDALGKSSISDQAQHGSKLNLHW